MTQEEIAADEIAFAEIYRGIGLHRDQPPARFAFVRAEIDYVASANGVQELFEYCKNPAKPPEARRFAGQKVLVHLRHAGNRRRPAGITREKVLAHTAGLSSCRWRDPDNYGSLLGTPMPGVPRPVRREVPLDRG